MMLLDRARRRGARQAGRRLDGDVLAARGPARRRCGGCSTPAASRATRTFSSSIASTSAPRGSSSSPAARRRTGRSRCAFQNRRAHKTYRALVWGHPAPPQGVLEDPLGRDPKDGRRMKVRADGKPRADPLPHARATPVRRGPRAVAGDRPHASDPRSPLRARAPDRRRRPLRRRDALARRARSGPSPRARRGRPAAPPRRARRDPGARSRRRGAAARGLPPRARGAVDQLPRNADMKR